MEQRASKSFERAFRNGHITAEFALFMSSMVSRPGITDGRRGCKATMAVYQSCINERAQSSPRNDDNMLRASCLKRQLSELNTSSPCNRTSLPSPPTQSLFVCSYHPVDASTPTVSIYGGAIE